ncbi:hypothetical protein DFJ73DRAFT_847179 [Zopfochytrium polystomum]|nr:hypothetical protein DFJ73DRAFT_847179 [Zopfochytrium polystomum]
MPATYSWLAALSYHTSYRALILLFPQMERRLWPIAGAVAFVEVSLHMFNLAANFGTIPDPNEQKISMTLMVYVIATDTIFFVASQARIVYVMAQVNKVKVSLWHYVDALLRCVCYSGAVFLYFVTAGEVFLSVPPCIMIMVLLTDADRVRKLVAALQQNSTAFPTSDVKTLKRGSLQPPSGGRGMSLST